MNDKLVISKKKKEKGQYGYKVFSVRVKEETVESLNQISKKTNRSRNDIINLFLEFGLNNYKLEE